MRNDVVLNQDPGGRRNNVFIYHEAEYQESSGDEHERSNEEDTIDLQLNESHEDNDGLNQC